MSSFDQLRNAFVKPDLFASSSPDGNPYQLLLGKDGTLAGFRPKDSGAQFWNWIEGKDQDDDIFKYEARNFPTDYFQPNTNQLADVNRFVSENKYSLEPGEGRSVVGFRTIDAIKPEIAGRGIQGQNTHNAGWGWADKTPATSGSYQVAIYGPSNSSGNPATAAPAPPPTPARPFESQRIEDRLESIATVNKKPVLPNNPGPEFNFEQMRKWRGDEQEAKKREQKFENVLARMNAYNSRPYNLG